MKLIISFSGRADGNCDRIASFIAADGDEIVHFRALNAHPCANCGYECFSGECRYRADDVYALYDRMTRASQVMLIVPIYGGNPPALYFAFCERGQDYFMHNDTYEQIRRRLFLIGVYGQQDAAPDFLPALGKWFDNSPLTGHVLGIERHRYGQKLGDCVLDVADVRAAIRAFCADAETESPETPAR